MNDTAVVEYTVIPADHASNRLGVLVRTSWGGEIYKLERGATVPEIYFAWPEGDRRGYRFDDFDGAAKTIGMVIPIGCSDYDGKVRLGKMIERHGENEIWKHGNHTYFVWTHGIAYTFYSLGEARASIGVNVASSKTEKTLPKSAYPQNNKGYRASGMSSSKKAK